VGASCTAELIQDDPGGLARALDLPVPVVAVELPAYQKKENWGSAETFYQLVRAFAKPGVGSRSAGRPRCNILGPTALGFRHRDDVTEITGLLDRLGIDVNVTAPLGATPADLARLGDADFNVVLYPETGMQAAQWLLRTFGQKLVKTVPIGIGATRDFIAEVAALAGVDPSPLLDADESRLPWYSRSVDSTYLTGKRVFIFGDATHAIAAARIASEAGHADGTAYRQAPGHSLFSDIRAGACAGLSGPLLAADGFRGCQCHLRHLGASVDDGPGRTSAGHVPGRLGIQGRSWCLASW
jgi:light-independent protochlorophyllide reductase subunit B